MLQILTHGEQLVVDSRLVADELEILHKNLVSTINKYKNEIESDFGCLLFETDDIKMPNGGTSERFSHYLITEDQSLYIMSLSRNTDKVRACKRNLVKAFSQAKQIIKEVIPQQNETIEMLKLQNEVLGKELSLRQLDHTMLTLHGKEIVLALRGYGDQVVKVEQVVTEIVDVQKGTSEKILTADQLKKEIKKQTGQNLKSQSDFIKELRKIGRDDLIVAVDRRVTNEYVIPDKLDEAIALVYGNSKQRLLGE